MVDAPSLGIRLPRCELFTRWSRRRPGKNSAIIAVVLIAAVGVVLTPARALAEPPPRYLFSWGSRGGGVGEFEYPRKLAVDSDDRVFVADVYNDRVQVFSKTGEFMFVIGDSGSANGEFKTPYAVALDATGNVYVVDSGNGRIQKFTAQGAYLTQWPIGAVDMAIGPDGSMYVVDRLNGFAKYTPDGQFVYSRGGSGTGPGQFHTVHGIAADATGYVYVPDAYNNRVQKFSADGTYLGEWSTVNETVILNYPFYVCPDGHGNVYVTGTFSARAGKFTDTGTYLSSWGAPGSGPGLFSDLVGIAVASDGTVFTTGYNDHNVQAFGPIPEIASIADVGGDDGGQVRITFLPSAWDAANALHPILTYEVFRRIESGFITVAAQLPAWGSMVLKPLVPQRISGTALAGWEYVGAVPAHGESEYSVVVPTLVDSTLADGVRWSTFYVRAATTDPLVFRDSRADSGYSIDNLAPPSPTELAMTLPGLLIWSSVPVADMLGFNIYGSLVPLCQHG